MKHIKLYESRTNLFDTMKKYIIWENRDAEITLIRVDKIKSTNIKYSIVIFDRDQDRIVFADQEISKNFFLNSYINNKILLETDDFEEALNEYILLISTNKYNL